MAPQDWPQGCLGYAFNLVRPTKPGHRASLLYSLLGNVLLFETLADASAYRELVTQVWALQSIPWTFSREHPILSHHLSVMLRCRQVTLKSFP